MVFLPSWPKCKEHKFANFQLDNIKELLNLLGNPHKKLKNVIHIAGTNGKGSTLSFLRAILEEYGYSVNCFTSPHLVEINERIVIKGEQIKDEQLNDVLKRCEMMEKQMKIRLLQE